MARARIRPGDGAFFRKGEKLERIEKRLANPEAALKQIGAMMVAESQLAFRDQKLGKRKWPERSDVNVFGIIADFHAGKAAPPQRRFETRPALHDTGRLAASINFRLVGTEIVEVGTNLRYARAHHTGDTVESEKITSDVQRRLWRWLKGKGHAYKKRLGWLLNKKFTDQTLTMRVPERPIVAITDQTRRDVRRIVGVEIMEAK